MKNQMINGLANVCLPGGNAARLSIVIYHRVTPEYDPLINEVDPATFTWHLELYRRHFNVLPLSEAIERLYRGDLPARALSITFDDGYLDNYTHAMPLLQRFGFSGAFFIATGFWQQGIMWNDRVIESIRATAHAELDLRDIGGQVWPIATVEQKRDNFRQVLLFLKYRPLEERLALAEKISQDLAVTVPRLMMQPDEVKAMRAGGMEIGAHTINHPILAVTPSDIVRREIATSKHDLESVLGEKVTLFAYPNGKPDQDYKREHVEIVKSLGFTAAVSTAWGVSRTQTDRFQLARFTPWDKSPNKFLMRLLRNGFSPFSAHATE
jgi:peptidoglycan/xylan/chitin deacetylase (PgdA/CDA1 family)